MSQQGDGEGREGRDECVAGTVAVGWSIKISWLREGSTVGCLRDLLVSVW